MKNFTNDGLADDTRRCGFFSNFQYSFGSLQSTSYLLTKLLLIELLVFDSPGDTQAMPIHISTAFDWVWHVGLLQKLKSYGISGSIFDFIHLFSVTDSLRWFWMGSVRKIISLMLEFLKVPILFLHFSDYISMTFMMMLSVILLSMLMILHSTLKGIRH